MSVAHRLAATCAALLILLALGAGSALAAPAPSATERIFADYADNRVIDGDYTAAQLDQAIEVAKTFGGSFSVFQAAVQEKYDRDILGLDASGPASSGDGTSLLPVPTAPGERDQPPWPFLALSALGAVLVLTGAGSSIYRRARR